jgi:hypothetical protein
VKAISLWQPWASLWISPAKLDETRHWPTLYRGPLAVHAAKTFVRDFGSSNPILEILEDKFGPHWSAELPVGALIGVVNLICCVPTDDLVVGADNRACGDFSPGRYAWRRASDFKVLSRPIPWRGRQRIFNVPDDLLATVA